MKPVMNFSPLLPQQREDEPGGTPWTLPQSDVQFAPVADGHVYRLLVSWPDTRPPRDGWPVLWLLDGEETFALATITARRMGRRNRAEGLIVAIACEHRGRHVEDCTPTIPGYRIPDGFPACGLPTGGAERFLDLIEGVFRPLVESRWPLDPARQTLAGQRFGGLLALHALLTGRPYSSIVAVSPSLWYGGDAMAATERKADPRLRTRLLIANGARPADLDDHGGAAAEALVTRWRRQGAEAWHLSLPVGPAATMLAATGATVATAFSTVSLFPAGY